MVDTSKNEKFVIKMVVDKEGAVEFTGLPQRFVYPVNNFRDEEIRADPLSILQAVIRDAEGFDTRDRPEPQDGADND